MSAARLPATCLADWLRDQDDTVLATLLRTRPDLAVPVPPDTGVLATRAGIRASVSRACDDLDTFTLIVLEALVVLDAHPEPVGWPDLVRILGDVGPVRRTRAALDALRDRVIVWGGDDALCVLPAAREVSSRHPGRLGRPSPALADVDLPALLDGCDPDERRVLDALAADGPLGRSRPPPPGAADTPVRRLLARGLLVRVDAETVELPRQVGLALRGDRPLGPVRSAPPTLATKGRTVAGVDATAAGEVLAVLRRVEALLAAWSLDPPVVLRSGGLGRRELRRLARDLEVDERGAALLVEVVVAAGLVADSDGTTAEWVPTTQADRWLTALPGQRWVTLARSWLELPRLPGLVGARDEADRLLGALSPELGRPLAPRERRRVLAALAELPPGHGVVSVDGLAALLAWRAPRRGGRLREQTLRWTVAESSALGIVALEALSSAGRELLDPDGAPAAALARALPPPVHQVLLQADLTAVAPGPLEPELAAEMARLGEVESAGGATVYRITEAGVRRALDAGRSTAELHQLLRTRSATPVPQGLTYLVDDVARRHGRLRGGAAGSFLRSDDETLLTEVLSSRAGTAARLELRRIAPTVLVSPLPITELLDGLRASGFAPVAENTTGAVVDLAPAPRRIPPRSRPPGRAAPGVPDEPQITAMLAQMRAGDRAAAAPRGTASTQGESRSCASATLAALAEAVRQRQQVLIGYVDAYGVATQRVVEPLQVGGGVFEGRDPDDGEPRRFMLHRITRAETL